MDMKKLNILFFWAAIFTGCASPTGDDRSNTDTSSRIADTVAYNAEAMVGSYFYEKNGDTVAMHLNVQGDSVVGQLIYALREKDLNSGNFKGVLVDSVLIATYVFESEGQQSSRQIAFKFDGKSAIEGYGEVLQQDTGFIFKNPDHLKFGDGIVLEKHTD